MSNLTPNLTWEQYLEIAAALMEVARKTAKACNRSHGFGGPAADSRVFAAECRANLEALHAKAFACASTTMPDAKNAIPNFGQRLDEAFACVDMPPQETAAPKMPIKSEHLTISIERASKSIAIFDGFEPVRAFEKYEDEHEALRLAQEWCAERSDNSPGVAYPCIKKMTMTVRQSKR